MKDRVEITNKGRIFKNGVELKPYIRSDKGTYVIFINKKRYALATLVAKNFVPNPFNYRNLIFKDRNRLNCSAENLDWVSNVEYSLYCGFFTPPIVRTKQEAIELAKCKYLKKFYLTGEREYLVKCWREAMKKINIYKLNDFVSFVWEYFESRAMRYSLVDPVYLIIIYSKSARRKHNKQINLTY